MSFLIFILAFAVLAGAGTLIWKHYRNCSGDCRNYDTKMSWVCEMSCAAKNYEKDKVVSNSTAKPGELTKCPISGVVFTVNENSGIVKRGDFTYHTCCGTCANMYTEDSSKYAANFN